MVFLMGHNSQMMFLLIRAFVKSFELRLYKCYKCEFFSFLMLTFPGGRAVRIAVSGWACSLARLSGLLRLVDLGIPAL